MFWNMILSKDEPSPPYARIEHVAKWPVPSGLLYETLDSICPFTVVIIDRVAADGWKSEACSYLVDASWNVK